MAQDVIWKRGFLSPRYLTGWQTYQCDWYKGGMKLLEPTTFIGIPSVPCTWAGCTGYITIPTSQWKWEVNWLAQGQPGLLAELRRAKSSCLTAVPYSPTTLSVVILYISFHFFFHLENSLPLCQTLHTFGQVSNPLKLISARIWFRDELFTD